ncbi:MAG: VTT domain-containing protein [Candidatus Berkelbacteria bacterium]|nr:VTT domain-containing protein [Candidatus Berkelbacteria bacterium]MCR4307056.1 VTT domain-containing protein [Candidatus Berkelbacteria bacterium]
MLEKLKQNQALQLVIFIFIFGLFVAVFSFFINGFLEPHLQPLNYLVEIHPYRALMIYFSFVVVASVVVPIPTLPVDLLFFGLLDPGSVIVARIAGGIAGGSVSYYLAYNYGRPLLKRWLSGKNYQFIEKHSNSLSWQQFFIIAMIPAINAELMAYVGGVGKIGYRKTIGTLLLGIGYRVLFVYMVLQY